MKVNLVLKIAIVTLVLLGSASYLNVSATSNETKVPFVPIEIIEELFNPIEKRWNEATSSASIIFSTLTISMGKNHPIATVNGVAVDIATAIGQGGTTLTPIMYSNRFFVPLAFFTGIVITGEKFVMRGSVGDFTFPCGLTIHLYEGVDIFTISSATVTAYALNVRHGPGNKYPVFNHLRRGDTVTVLNISANGKWFQVDTLRGTGWVFGRYLNLH